MDKMKLLDSCQTNDGVYSVYDYDAYTIQELLCDYYNKINKNASLTNQLIDIIEHSGGIQGPQGEPGPMGPMGPQGDPGVNGENGATGPRGPKGDRGDVGPGITFKGEVEDGPALEVIRLEHNPQEGDSYYMRQGGHIWVFAKDSRKFVDVGAIKGVPGEKGEPGLNGAQGETGPVGPAGPTGAQGPVGERGPQGEQGIPGFGVPAYSGANNNQILGVVGGATKWIDKPASSVKDIIFCRTSTKLTISSKDFSTDRVYSQKLTIRNVGGYTGDFAPGVKTIVLCKTSDDVPVTLFGFVESYSSGTLVLEDSRWNIYLPPASKSVDPTQFMPSTLPQLDSISTAANIRRLTNRKSGYWHGASSDSTGFPAPFKPGYDIDKADAIIRVMWSESDTATFGIVTLWGTRGLSKGKKWSATIEWDRMSPWKEEGAGSQPAAGPKTWYIKNNNTLSYSSFDTNTKDANNRFGLWGTLTKDIDISRDNIQFAPEHGGDKSTIQSQANVGDFVYFKEFSDKNSIARMNYGKITEFSNNKANWKLKLIYSTNIPDDTKNN